MLFNKLVFLRPIGAVSVNLCIFLGLFYGQFQCIDYFKLFTVG